MIGLVLLEIIMIFFGAFRHGLKPLCGRVGFHAFFVGLFLIHIWEYLAFHSKTIKIQNRLRNIFKILFSNIDKGEGRVFPKVDTNNP